MSRSGRWQLGFGKVSGQNLGLGPGQQFAQQRRLEPPLQGDGVEPLRLTVIIEAPRDAIKRVISEHAVVRELIEHRWLHLMRIDSASLDVERFDQGAWLHTA